MPFINNIKSINNTKEKNKRFSFKLKFKISPKKYLLNLDSISQRKDSIFQFDKIKDCLEIIKKDKNKSVDENYPKKIYKDNKCTSEEKSNNINVKKNKKFGLTIYCNNKYNIIKLSKNNKEKEKDEKNQNNNIELKYQVNKKTLIQNFTTNIKNNQDLDKKKFYIRNFNNDHENNSKTNIINANNLIKTPSEIFKNQLIKRQNKKNKLEN